MKELVAQLGLVGLTVSIVLLVSGLLSALSAFLEKVKDTTSSDLDNKLFAAIQKIIPILQIVADFLSGSVKKPVAAPTAVVAPVAAPAAEVTK